MASTADTTVSSDVPAGPAVELRAGNHGSEDRVVLEFFGVDGIEVLNHSLDEKPPVRGGSGEPIPGMTGTVFLHVVVVGVPATMIAPTSPTAYDLPIVKSAVVNDIEGGTLEAGVGLAASVDYEVKVEGNKIIVNMAQGPLGR
ncbi:AMIN-like domain-containing (lipo)protein [Actinophytocola sp.]|uniref:AMIN-like domain-containing (lipo)protein n=1 Tax=Actinophytocola sp. TaxID=1872138 RepID=UPI002ED46E07